MPIRIVTKVSKKWMVFLKYYQDYTQYTIHDTELFFVYTGFSNNHTEIPAVWIFSYLIDFVYERKTNWRNTRSVSLATSCFQPPVRDVYPTNWNDSTESNCIEYDDDMRWWYGMTIWYDSGWPYEMMIRDDHMKWWYGMTIWDDDTRWWYGMIIRDDDTGWWYEMMIRDDDMRWWWWWWLWVDDMRWWYEIMIRDDDIKWWHEMMTWDDDTGWWYGMMRWDDDTG